MNKEEYKQLKVGDIVSHMRGKNKNRKAVVTYIWDLVDSDKYHEIIIFGTYLYPDGEDKSFNLSYKSLKRETSIKFIKTGDEVEIINGPYAGKIGIISGPNIIESGDGHLFFSIFVPGDKDTPAELIIDSYQKIKRIAKQDKHTL